MNLPTKIGLAVAAVGATAYTVTTSSSTDPPEYQVLEPYGTFGGGGVIDVEGLTGVPVEQAVEDALTLARIKSRPAKITPIIAPPTYGTITSGPDLLSVTTWEVTLDDGRTLRLELRGAMQMNEGETIEQARERFARTQD